MSVKPLHANGEAKEPTLTSLLSIVVGNVVRGVVAGTGGMGLNLYSLAP